MKTLAEIDQLLQKFEKQYGLSIRGHEQLSPAWFQTKLGVISASNASKAVAKKGTETRTSYLCELVAQVCTGVIEEISAEALDWGRQHEDAARSAFEFANDLKIQPLTFAFKDDTFRAGCSSDGIVRSISGFEIKAPFKTANYVKFVLSEKLKPEYKWQNQFGMWVLEAECWETFQYDPRMKTRMHHSIIEERDPEYQKQLDDTIPEFIHDMDAALQQFGIKFGDHWARLAKLQQESA